MTAEDHTEHHRKLERLYAAAPITQWSGTRITVADGQAEVRLAARPERSAMTLDPSVGYV
jgi:hypothetical protein